MAGSEDNRGQANDPSQWPVTIWPEVYATTQAVGQDEKLPYELLQKYNKPLEAYLRYKFREYPRVLSHAGELLHDFSTSRVLVPGWLAKATPERGKFRNFLKTSLTNFVLDWWRKQPEYKTSDEDDPVWSRGTASGTGEKTKSPARVREEPLPDDDTLAAPGAEDLAFDREWLRVLFAEVLERMEQQCKSPGKVQPRNALIWEIFRMRKLDPIFQGVTPPPYGELTKRLGLRSPGEGHFMLHVAKQIFQALLYQIFAEYENAGRATQMEVNDIKVAIQTLTKMAEKGR